MWILLDSDDWINLDFYIAIVRRKDGTGAALPAHNKPDDYTQLTARDMQRIHERLLNAEQR